MINKFTIGRTRHCVFTKEQIAKIEAGLDLFEQAFQHKDFESAILSHSWLSSAGIRYKRFLSSNNLSNIQVWNRLKNFKLYFTNSEELSGKIAILPCNSRRDMHGYSNFASPTIWINKGYLNQDWYTPVHVASCIAHELCDNLGFQSYISGQTMEQCRNSVSFFCGNLIMKICKKWKENVTAVRESFYFIDDKKYNYFPCSIVFQTQRTNLENPSANHKIDELIDHLSLEIDALKNLPEAMNTEEFTRYSALEKSVQTLQNLQKIMAQTSLDGTDALMIAPLVYESKYFA